MIKDGKFYLNKVRGFVDEAENDIIIIQNKKGTDQIDLQDAIRQVLKFAEQSDSKEIEIIVSAKTI